MAGKALEIVESGRFLSEEFVLWLWKQGLTEGGTSGVDGDMTACFVDDSVKLVTERGDVKEVSLRKGNPAESREAFEAMSRGMRVASAKLRLLSADMEWTFTINASTLDVSGMKMPPTQSKDPAGRLADRLFLAEEGLGHIERRFGRFLDLRTADAEALETEINNWLKGGLVGEGGGGGEVPWEE